ncbi:hypothetical protein [Actinoplanes sp. NPDC051494]|uniref:hypothetical protein n=1 Tax=Actinoplanes sp. NPDC051494 TaxID=3363907 RepID=UPI0037BAC5C4
MNSITTGKRWSPARLRSAFTVRSRPPAERAAYVVGAVLMAVGVFHLGVFLVDGGSWEGPVSWRKPTTFGLSFGLTLITIAWISSHLVVGPRTRAWLLGLFTADCVLEVGGISLQAWRGVPSHFNSQTPFDRTVAMSLALGGAVLVGVLGTMAVVALRGRLRGTRDMRLALRAGFAFLLVGLATGVLMIVKGTTLYRSGDHQAAFETAGSWKPVHGVTLHAVLVLPLIAEGARLLGWDERRRHGAVVIGTGLYLVATLVAVLAVTTTVSAGPPPGAIPSGAWDCRVPGAVIVARSARSGRP